MKKIVFIISILVLLTILLFLGFKLIFNNKENNELDYTTIKENIISSYQVYVISTENNLSEEQKYCVYKDLLNNKYEKEFCLDVTGSFFKQLWFKNYLYIYDSTGLFYGYDLNNSERLEPAKSINWIEKVYGYDNSYFYIYTSNPNTNEENYYQLSFDLQEINELEKAPSTKNLKKFFT